MRVSQTDSVSRWNIREIEAAILANASSLGRTNGCSKHSSVRSSLHYVADPERWAEKLKEGLTRSHGDTEVKKAVLVLRVSVAPCENIQLY